MSVCRSIAVLAVAVSIVLLIPLSPASASRSPAAASKVAQVRYIKGGLAVTPPHKAGRKGKRKMPLYKQYRLQTKAQQRASIRFNDQTTLHMNEQTDVELKSPHLTYVQRGEIDQILMPGSNHRVQTASAIASAIGTEFDVRTSKGQSEFIVAHGALEVRNKQGSVVVKTNQETVVRTNRAPEKPKAVDAQAAIGWTVGIPAPTLPDNLSLGVNGGQIIDVSSQRSSAPVSNVNDGRLDTAWETAPGEISNQRLTVAFDGSKNFLVRGIFIDNAAQRGASPQTDLKDFAIQYSNTSADDKSFGTLFTGTLKQVKGLQWFPFSQSVRYLRLLAKSNYGSSDGISVAEVEVVGLPNTKRMFDFPEGVAVNPQGNVDVVDGGLGFVQRVSPDGKLLATLGDPGTGRGQIQAARGLAEDKAGNIYVMNFGNRLVKLSPKGKVLAEWGSVGSGPGQFANGNGVAVDSQSNVYVADSNNNRVQKFSSTGEFIAEFKGTPRPFGNILGIAVDGQGDMYVSNGAGDFVAKLSPSGQELTRWGTGGKGPGQFSHPVGIALDTQGNVYVADAQNSRVQKFTANGQYITSWPTPGVGSAPPIRPEYLAIDAQGNVYVTSDAHGQVVEKFAPDGKLLAQWQ